MSHEVLHIAVLFEKYLLGTLNDAEKQQLEDWVALDPKNQHLLARVTDHQGTLSELKRFERYDVDAIAQKIKAIDPQLPLTGAIVRPKPGVLRTMQHHWWRYAAAVLVLIIGGIWMWGGGGSQKPPDIAQTAVSDVPPGSDKAILTLSNGQQVMLDSASNRTIFDNGRAIAHRNGELRYEQAGRSVLNTMTTPKGGQYRLQLADGTRVWLNAMSSITFPTTFTGGERIVEAKGEVYFEVAPDKSRPFLVRTIIDTVTVLGTSFNVNRYTDEGTGKITLVSGSIKVQHKILAPGQSLVNGKIQAARPEQDIAWKNGFFDFTDADVPTILRQLARWYDVDVVYDGKIPELKYTGNLQRKLTLSQVVRSLAEVDIRLQLEGRTLHVLR